MSNALEATVPGAMTSAFKGIFLGNVRRNFAFLLAALITTGLSFGPKTRADFTIVNPTPPNSVPVAYATVPGYPAAATVSLAPQSTVVHLAVPSATSLLATTLTQDSGDYAGWTWNFAAQGLSGTLTVTEYKAVVYNHPGGNPEGGATISATYVSGTGDPSSLTFINMYKSSLPGSQPGGGTHIDRNNGAVGPVYYNPQQILNNQFNTNTFSDSPRDDVPATPAGPGVSNLFQTYLCSYDATNKVVTIYDGFAWGYLISAPGADPFRIGVEAVPEPSSILSFVVGVFGTAVIAHRRRRKASKA